MFGSAIDENREIRDRASLLIFNKNSLLIDVVSMIQKQ